MITVSYIQGNNYTKIKSENLEKCEDVMQLMLIMPWKLCVMI